MVRWFSRTKPPWLVGSFTAASHLGWHPMILLLHNISSLGQPALSHNGFPKFPKQLSNSYSTWISRTFINIQVSVRADYQWQSENENWVILIDATRGHNPNPWWHQNSPKIEGIFGVFWQFQSNHPRLKLAVRWLFDSYEMIWVYHQFIFIEGTLW